MAYSGQKVAFDAVEFMERKVGLSQFIHLAVEVAVDLPKGLLHGHQVMEHPVEGVRKLFEFVAGLNLTSDM